jgi:membrane-associated phospholipid phosphatase
MKTGARIGLALGGGVLCGLAWFLMRWDRAAMAVLYLRPVTLLETAGVLDYLGSWMVTIPVVALALAVFWRPGWAWLALRPMVMLASSELIAEAMKYFLHRPRPDFNQRTSDFWGYSFPSDHALCGLVLWFTVALVVGELWPEMRALAITLASLIALFTGWSQVLLGVNWPADVVAGWGIGLILIAAAPGPSPPQAGRVKAKKI